MYKTFKNWKWAALPMLLMGIAVAFFAFKKDDAFSRMTGAPALDMSYQVEKVTVKKYDNTAGTCYEGINELSDAENYNLKLSMSDAGEFEMTIGISDSPQDLSKVGFEEPNLRQVRSARINNSTMTTYDGNGNVIESQPNKGDAMSAASLKSVFDMSSSETYDAILNASMNGGTLTNAAGETAQVEPTKDGSVRIVSSNSIVIFDMTNKVIQAISTLGDNGKVVSERLIDSNRDSQGSFVLNAIVDISYDAVPNSNATITTTTTQKFNNFRLVDYSGKSTIGGK
jgi:hypothetical protein